MTEPTWIEPMVEPELSRFIEWLHGKELRQDAIGAVAQHIRDRPGSGPPPWHTDLELRTHARHHGPNCSQADIDAAILEFRAP